ncbi:MAG: hypothetical protein M0C28_23270 [Candidatus Moduliflexus flocculans]|nr:hypothetical protein [Candidatus Moduliflexus flocculans]
MKLSVGGRELTQPARRAQGPEHRRHRGRHRGADEAAGRAAPRSQHGGGPAEPYRSSCASQIESLGRVVSDAEVKKAGARARTRSSSTSRCS